MNAVNWPAAALLVRWIAFFVGKSVEGVDPATQAFPCPSTAIPWASSQLLPPRYVENSSTPAGLISLMNAFAAPGPPKLAWIGFFAGKSVEFVSPATQAFPCPSTAIAAAQSFQLPPR